MQIADSDSPSILQPEHGEMTTNGLKITASLTNEEWTQIGVRLGERLGYWIRTYDHGVSEVKWALGDWLVYGEAAHLGFNIERASRITRVPPDALRAYQSQSGMFSIRDRVTGATWQMHHAVMSFKLADAQRLLLKAVADNWEPERWAAAVRLQQQEDVRQNGGLPITVPAPKRMTPPMTDRRTNLFRKGVAFRRVAGYRCPECHSLVSKTNWLKGKEYQ